MCVGPAIAFGYRLQIAVWNVASRFALWHFERQARAAQRVNSDVLHVILKRNRATAIGRRLGFTAILAAPDSVGRFQERVPLSTYADYADDIERIAAGQDAILTSSVVDRFGGSSGTTGASKRIPGTAQSRAIYVRYAGLIMRGVLLRQAPPGWSRRPGINLMSMSVPNAAAPHALPLVSMTHAGIRAMRRWLSAFWTSPAVVFEVGDRNASMYLHALFALHRDDPVYIYDVFAPHLLAWLRLIDLRRNDLLRDIAAGSLAADLVLTPGEREHLTRHLVADPPRAATLRRHFAHGLRGIAVRIWPGLSVVSVVTTGGFSLCVPALRRYLGRDVHLHSPLFGATESLVGVNVFPATDLYTLACGAAYFEFISSGEGETRQSVDISELKIGAHYEVVVTTLAGLYRYCLDDVIEVAGFHSQAPLLRFLYRRGSVINLCGEKITEAQTAAALDRALGGAGRCVDYSVTTPITASGCCYRFYIELTDESRTPICRSARLARALDEALCAANTCYLSARHRARTISMLQVRLLRAGGFERLRGQLQARANLPGGNQTKTPRWIRDPATVAILETEVIRSSEFPRDFTALIE